MPLAIYSTTYTIASLTTYLANRLATVATHWFHHLPTHLYYSCKYHHFVDIYFSRALFRFIMDYLSFPVNRCSHYYYLVAIQ
jgi:hypothetical protein